MTLPEIETGTHVLLHRAGVYELLARLWSREVDAPLLAALRTGELRMACHDLGLPTASSVTDACWLEELAIDYCRIMIGPHDHAAPIQSVWVSGQYAGEVTEAMAQILKIVPSAPAVTVGVPDHFGTQLFTMARVLRGYDQLSEPPDRANLKACDQLANHLFAKHLDWATPMLRMASSLARTEFYGSVVELTQSWLSSERERFV